MEGIREYVLSLTAAALLCALLLAIPQEGTAKELTKLLCAVALTLCALGPLTRADWSQITGGLGDFESLGQAYASQGEIEARQAMEDIIKQRIAAYILDKAQELGLELEAQVELGDALLPAAVRLRGQVSPYPRQLLEETLSRELGIAKEKLIWIG